MYMYIGIEDLVANAIIELVENSQSGEVLFSQINRYGATVVQILSENDKRAILILSKERTNAFLHDYSDYFELFSRVDRNAGQRRILWIQPHIWCLCRSNFL